MKKYSSKQAKKGKTAYRTPSRFFNKFKKSAEQKNKREKLAKKPVF